MNGSALKEARRLKVAAISNSAPVLDLKGDPVLPGFELPLQDLFSKRY
jgi:hypothetical protein